MLIRRADFPDDPYGKRDLSAYLRDSERSARVLGCQGVEPRSREASRTISQHMENISSLCPLNARMQSPNNVNFGCVAVISEIIIPLCVGNVFSNGFTRLVFANFCRRATQESPTDLVFWLIWGRLDWIDRVEKSWFTDAWTPPLVQGFMLDQ